MAFVRVGPEDFDPGAEMERLQAEAGDAGAVASFLGIVRRGQETPIEAMTLEHYPAMTERAIARTAAEAEGRWALSGCRIIHRIGRIPVGGRIVLVLTASRHPSGGVGLDGLPHRLAQGRGAVSGRRSIRSRERRIGSSPARPMTPRRGAGPRPGCKPAPSGGEGLIQPRFAPRAPDLGQPCPQRPADLFCQWLRVHMQGFADHLFPFEDIGDPASDCAKVARASGRGSRPGYSWRHRSTDGLSAFVGRPGAAQDVGRRGWLRREGGGSGRAMHDLRR